ncbi:hypothetical protein NOV72_00271 [Caballeronia novacaledonica]|uniref:Purine nucleoside phosphorylase n=1 Tax=Caballeronia novacaledonica TaxID=1544861 RepID=A0A2U3HYU5_9BURK|nr:hypothetical protein [Caballeronia novacaledonica]SPB12971.1 hypothetical protein NOV72_00271 [Caballeronia novacaledonica]
MNKRLAVSFVIALSSLFAGSAFASGYGPAPHYRPDVGAPASQHGVSAQTFAAEEAVQQRGDFGDTERTAQVQRGQFSASAASQVAQ